MNHGHAMLFLKRKFLTPFLIFTLGGGTVRIFINSILQSVVCKRQ